MPVEFFGDMRSKRPQTTAARPMSEQVHVGTSGWHYKHWCGPFYPETLRPDEMLKFYSERLRTVEINNSFYHLPSPDAFRKWRDETPGDFRFAIKASRYITHMKKLKDPEQSLKKFLLHVEELGGKSGPILFQLPPHWKRDALRLKDFLRALPKHWRYAFEFREPSWFHQEIFSLLEQHNAAQCIYDLAGYQSPEEVTARFTYVRLHGPSAYKYAGRYSHALLRSWLHRVEEWFKQGSREVFVYFDNDQAGYAALNALEFQKLACGT
jgi:uncharacterized protein YecE (DUF72 family)